MSEYPTTDLNSQLIASGLNTNNPQQTYVDFATKMSQNAQEQASQEQAIARAKEMTKQAKIDTSDKESAHDAGYNPLLADSMTPEQAVAYLKIVMKAKGLEIEQADIDNWAKSLPRVVNRQIVESFANRFARETLRLGQPAMFQVKDKIDIPAGSTAKELGLVADEEDPSIGHVPEAGMYQVGIDNQGVVKKFVPGGKEAVDPSIKVGQKQEQFDAKRWSALENGLETVIKSSRGNQLSSAVFRADRALNEIADPKVLVPQVLSFIQKDLSGIFQGGVPPVSGMEKEEFETAFQALNRFVEKYTGFTAAFKTDTGDQRAVLTKLIVRLRDSTLDVLESLLKSKLEGYRDIIDKDTERWQRLLNDKMSAVRAGLTKEAQATTNANTEFPGQRYPTADPEMDALAGVLKLKKKTPAKDK